MGPYASPGLRCARCAALCRAQSRAKHQLDQALDARVVHARGAAMHAGWACGSGGSEWAGGETDSDDDFYFPNGGSDGDDCDVCDYL